MLTPPTIERHFKLAEHDRMLQAMTGAGTPVPLPLRIRLSTGPVAATALGLRRLVELTYGPSDLSQAMTDTLLDQQTPDGAFGPGPADPLTTAAAVAALGQVIDQYGSPPSTRLDAAYQRGLAALAAMQADDGLFYATDDRTAAEKATISAFILFLLAGNSAFRAAIRFAELMSWFDERSSKLEPATAALWTRARLEQRAAPAVAA